MRPLLSLAVLALSASAALADVTVFAAASLKTALDRIAADYTAATGVPVTPVYGGSPAMARQIAEGAPADIFLSASPEWMDDLQTRGLIQPDSRRDLLGNRLVLVAHGAASPVDLNGSTDLAALLGEGRLSMAMVESVPAGQYGAQALQALGLWDEVKDRLAQSENVRAALQLVALGEAPLGIVYATDALAEPKVRVLAHVPASSHDPIVYPVARVLGADPAQADGFLRFLTGAEARVVFERAGFSPP